MEHILNEYRQFLQAILDEFPIPQGDVTVSGMKEKVIILRDFSRKFNEKGTAKANELLDNADASIDKNKLKDALIQTSIDYHGKHVATL